jgi:hypothetical protein
MQRTQLKATKRVTYRGQKCDNSVCYREMVNSDSVPEMNIMADKFRIHWKDREVALQKITCLSEEDDRGRSGPTFW